MLEHNPDTVKIVLKNMPLNFHKFAQPAALAALAAGEQGKFWEFHDLLFAAKPLNQAAIDRIATKLDLDIPRFKRDRESAKVKGQLARDLAAADKAGVTGTPTVFVNGRQPSSRSIEAIQALINQELAGLEK